MQLNRAMRRSKGFRKMSIPEKVKRSLEEIRNEYSVAMAEAGELSFQIAVLDARLKAKHQQLSNLNLEGSEASDEQPKP